MNETQFERLLREIDAHGAERDPVVPGVIVDRVRRRARARAARRTQAIGLVSALGLAVILAVPGGPERGRAPERPVAATSARLQQERANREAELATMVVTALRNQRDADARLARAVSRNAIDTAAVETEQAANVLLAQARVLTESPSLREAANWRCELIITAFPESEAADEARRILAPAGRSDSGSPIWARRQAHSQDNTQPGVTL